MINSYSSIGEIQSLVRSLQPESRKLFNNIYDVIIYSGEGNPSPDIESSIKREFGSIRSVQSQRIIKIANKVMSHSVTYNPLFDVRIEEGSGVPNLVETKFSSNDLVEGSPNDMSMGSMTEPFNQVTGDHSVVMGALVKADVYHGLLVPISSRASPLNVDMFKDYLQTAWRWIRTAHTYDKSAVYPLIAWNARRSHLTDDGQKLEPMQLFLGKGNHYSSIEKDRRSASLYNEGIEHYFKDLFLIHEALGLGYSKGETKTFVNLTPSLPGSEIVVMSKDKPESAIEEMCHVFDMLSDKFASEQFGISIVSPPLGSAEDQWSGFPSMARFVIPDESVALRFGFDGMDSFGQPVITRDPFVLARGLLID
tara:strand:- start:96 stop:1193 length:1098 start_codon:yes stop_codon:yes gene_type:complete